jgi:hypothetical protein
MRLKSMRHAEPRGPNVTLWSVVAGIPRPVATWMLGVDRGKLDFQSAIQRRLTTADKSCGSTIYAG